MVNPQKITASAANTPVRTVFSVPFSSMERMIATAPQPRAPPRKDQIMPLGIQFL